MLCFKKISTIPYLYFYGLNEGLYLFFHSFNLADFLLGNDFFWVPTYINVHCEITNCNIWVLVTVPHEYACWLREFITWLFLTISILGDMIIASGWCFCQAWPCFVWLFCFFIYVLPSFASIQVPSVCLPRGF